MIRFLIKTCWNYKIKWHRLRLMEVRRSDIVSWYLIFLEVWKIIKLSRWILEVAKGKHCCPSLYPMYSQRKHPSVWDVFVMTEAGKVGKIERNLRTGNADILSQGIVWHFLSCVLRLVGWMAGRESEMCLGEGSGHPESPVSSCINEGMDWLGNARDTAECHLDFKSADSKAISGKDQCGIAY